MLGERVLCGWDREDWLGEAVDFGIDFTQYILLLKKLEKLLQNQLSQGINFKKIFLRGKWVVYN